MTRGFEKMLQRDLLIPISDRVSKRDLEDFLLARGCEFSAIEGALLAEVYSFLHPLYDGTEGTATGRLGESNPPRMISIAALCERAQAHARNFLRE